MAYHSCPLLPGSQHEPTQRIRCPIHGFIKYSEAERRIIDHPAFMRLRHVKQLSFCYYVYPGATHTRFEHTFGVLELVTRAFDTVCQKKRDDLKEQLAQVPVLADDTLEKARQVLRLLALFHDIGHTPFSHSGEIGEKHEKLSRRIVATEFGDKLDEWFFEGCKGIVCELLSADDSQMAPQMLVLRSILAGEMDMDRADYLARDSHHCGVEYGVFDHARLIDSLNLVPSHSHGLLDLCVERGGFHSVEALLLARYQMNMQVYYHRVRRIYDHYLARFLHAWIKTGETTVEKFQCSDDMAVFEAIKKHSSDPGSPANQWASRLVNRVHHRLVFESKEHEEVVGVRAVKTIRQEGGEKFPEWDFYLDEKAEGNVHKLLVPGDTERFGDLLVLDTRSGSTEHIGYKSKVIGKIPREFHVLRLYVYPREGELTRDRRDGLGEIGRWCLRRYHEEMPVGG